MSKPSRHQASPSAVDSPSVWRQASGEMIMGVAIVATSVSTVLYAILERLF